MVTSESEDRRTSVAQTLPFDILGEIFLHIAALQFHDLGPISVIGKAKPLYGESLHLLNATEPPLLLCHVCQTWKNAALNISQLWDGVYLLITYFQSSNLLRKGPGSEENPEISHTTDVLDAQSIQFVEWWENNVNIALSESPTSSLLRRPSFCFRRKEAEISDLSSAYKGPSLAQFFATPFFRSARRIELDVLDKRVLRALYYSPSDTESGQESLSTSPLHFENLLELRIQKFTYRSDYGQPGYTFPPSPSLLKLHVSLLHYNAFLGDNISSPFFPFAQLTHISLSNPIVHAAWKLLLITCTHLVSAAVNLYIRPDDGQSDQQNQILVPALRHLSVSCKQLYAPTAFYEFNFTNLTSLRIISADLNRFKSLNGIELFLRATPKLRELHFDFCLSFENFQFIPFDYPPPAYADSRLSALVPNLRLLVVDYVDPGDANVGKNIIRFLYSKWLCLGWEPHSRKERQLEFHIMLESYFTSKRCSDYIFHELNEHLLQYPDHPAFDRVSMHRGNRGEKRYEVFDLTRRGWDEALQFRYP